jgi:hypothetical protein
LTSARHGDSKVGRGGVSFDLPKNLVPLHVHSSQGKEGLGVELCVAKCRTDSAGLASSREDKVIELNSVLVALTSAEGVESLEHASKRAEVTFASRVPSSRQGSTAIVLATVSLVTSSRMELDLSLGVQASEATRSVGIALGKAAP